MLIETGEHDLIEAAKKGDATMIATLLHHGAAVNAKDLDGTTPLHIAAQNGHAEIVQMLLAKGAAGNTKDLDDTTPLHDAAQNGHAEIVQMLLEAHAAVNAKDAYDATPLHYAAQNGHAEIVQMLLAKDADVNAKDLDGATPLHIAAQNGHAEIVQMLLEAHAAVNAKDAYDATPLHYAAQDGHAEIVQMLLAKDADVNTRLVNGEDLDGRTPLHLAALWGYQKVVKQLLDACADEVNAIDAAGATPLHHAAQWGHVKVVQVLLNQGATRDCRDHNEKTALDLAVANNHLRATLLLGLCSKSGEEKPTIQFQNRPWATSLINTILKYGQMIPKDFKKSSLYDIFKHCLSLPEERKYLITQGLGLNSSSVSLDMFRHWRTLQLIKKTKGDEKLHWTTCLGSVHKISSDISFTIIEYLFNPKEKETELPIYTGALIQQWSKTPEAQENQQQAGKLLLELADYKISTEVSKILGPLAWEKTTKKDPDDEKRHASGDSNHNDKGSAKPPSKRHKRSNKT